MCSSEACNFIKKRLQHWCFPVKPAKFLRTSSIAEHFRWLLLFTLPYLHILAYTYLHLLIYTYTIILIHLFFILLYELDKIDKIWGI